MPEYGSAHRPSRTQNLPVAHPRWRKHVRASKFDLPASLTAQLIVNHQQMRLEPHFQLPPLNAAVDSYRSGAAITDIRIPAGFRRTISA